MKRRLQYVAPFDGEAADILKRLGVSSSVIKSLRKSLGLVCKIADGEVPVRLNDRLKKGERFCIYLIDKDVKPISKIDVKVNIVYEDEDLAVIDKQSGIAVMPAKGHYGRCLSNALANIWGDFVYRPVNRLDRDTSGLMIVAKNQLAHSALTGRIQRKYVALCSGVFEGDKKGVIDLPLKQSPDGFRRRVDESGARAVTEYEILNQYERYFSVRFLLRTGRTHQIRAHASHLGYPICCDKLYNHNPEEITCPNGKILNRQALHSYYIEFIHPMTAKEMSFTSQAEFL